MGNKFTRRDLDLKYQLYFEVSSNGVEVKRSSDILQFITGWIVSI